MGFNKCEGWHYLSVFPLCILDNSFSFDWMVLKDQGESEYLEVIKQCDKYFKIPQSIWLGKSGHF